jgi:hypothetical protein
MFHPLYVVACNASSLFKMQGEREFHAAASRAIHKREQNSWAVSKANPL